MQKEIDIRQMLHIFRKKLWLIVLLSAIGMAVAFSISRYLLKPVYSAKVTLYVYNQTRTQDSATLNDINLSQRLVNTYIVILKSDAVLSSVASKVDYGYSVQQLRDMIRANAVDSTEVFEVSVRNTDPHHAQIIANTLAATAPGEIIRVVKAGSVEVIDYAKYPDFPVSPNIPSNTVIGFLLGLILAVGIALLTELLDTTINDESDLIENYNLPILGVIPQLNKTTGRKGEKNNEYKSAK